MGALVCISVKLFSKNSQHTSYDVSLYMFENQRKVPREEKSGLEDFEHVNNLAEHVDDG